MRAKKAREIREDVQKRVARKEIETLNPTYRRAKREYVRSRGKPKKEA
jgi:hypothetical protein